MGKDGQDAAFEQSRKEAELNAANHGVAVTEQPQDGSGNGRRSLAAAVTEYLADIKLNKKHKTHAAYSTALEYFLNPARSLIWKTSTAETC